MSVARDWMAEQQRRLDRELLDAYRGAREAILAQIDELLGARVHGGPPLTRAQLTRAGRLARLLADVESHIAHFSGQALVIVLRGQQEAVAVAATHTLDAIAAELPAGFGFNPSFPDKPFSELVGRLSNGRPLAALLDTLGPMASQAVREALLTGVALGRGPREIARDIRRVTAMPAARALTIARTEVLGSFREATRQTMAANRDTVSGWIWEAALGPRTCAACVAQHGSVHSVDESMQSHPNCRCAMVPKTKTWAELGVPDVPETSVTPRSGEDWLREQDEATQRAILGPSKFEAYRQGRVSLGDFVQRTDSRTWGPGTREASLDTALAQAGRRTTTIPRRGPGG